MVQEALKEEQVKVEAALAAERRRAPAASSGEGALPPGQQADAPASADPLDAYMTGLATDLEHDKVRCLHTHCRAG